MSGHSKWHNIQKTKGAQDAKRAAAFTKISKEMIVAVKEGGGIADPLYNSRLATAITKAKAANMRNFSDSTASPVSTRKTSRHTPRNERLLLADSQRVDIRTLPTKN